MAKLVYVLDDDDHIRAIIEKFLIYEGFQVDTFRTGRELLTAIEEKIPDCYVLDVMLPDISGFSVCTKIREKSMVPILFVSAKGEETDRILGLEIGGDDYITKPFSGRELAVRVKSLIRRSIQQEATDDIGNFTLGNLIYKMTEREILSPLGPIAFTSKEYDLFLLLSRNAFKAFSREELLRKIWKWEVIEGTRSVDDLVKRIRKKLTIAKALVEIKTVFGFGYKVVDESTRNEHENSD
ncbi:MAG: response regulator transcription factor [Candidatus Izemoplasmatales bacterium]|jgi:DNA-binding response OmpR family regulator|nr:response regulator transcription factor [Candidatus Izemoplasmatales bacterium]